MNADEKETHHQHHDDDRSQTRHPLVENEEEGKSSKKRGNRRGSNSSSSSSSISNSGGRKNDETQGDFDCNPVKEGPPGSSAAEPNHSSPDSDDRRLSSHSHLEPPSRREDSNDSQKNTRPESNWEKRQKQRRRRDRRRRVRKQRLRHPQRLRIETANFQSQFHGTLCRAARYKAHAPYCSCFRAVSFRERYRRQQREIELELEGEHEQEQNEQELQQPYREGNDGGSDEGTDSKEEEEYENEPTVLTREFNKLQLTDLNISGKDGIADDDADVGIDHDVSAAADDNNNNYSSNNNKDDDDNCDPFDNLLVIPDTRSPSAIYSCRNTNTHRFRSEGAVCEMKLAREIFFENLGDDDDDGNDSNINHNNNLNESVPIPPFKLTCAQCLLRTHQPNAFLALCSDSFLDMHAIVQHVHQAARIQSSQSPEKARHADHAHFVASVTVRSLTSFLPKSVTKKKSNRPLIKTVLRHLHRGGGTDVPDVFLPKKKGEGDGDEETEGNDANVVPRPVIELGHHLTSLLYALVNLRQLSQPPPPLIEEKMKFIMVIGYRDDWNKWTLDLPGGKRHLGETTLQSLLREVEEECSLEMRVDWWMERMPRLYGGNNCCDLDGSEIGKFNWDEVGGMDDGGDIVVFGKGGLDEIGNGNENENDLGERDDGGDFVVFGKDGFENSDGRRNYGLVHVLQTERKGYDNTDVFVVAVPPPRALQDEFLNME